jgi:hypothetical protein
MTLAVPLFIVGAGGLVRFLYKGWWGQAAFVVVWLVGLVLITRFNYLRSRNRWPRQEG